jgi:hypothetical protein
VELKGEGKGVRKLDSLRGHDWREGGRGFVGERRWYSKYRASVPKKRTARTSISSNETETVLVLKRRKVLVVLFFVQSVKLECALY